MTRHPEYLSSIVNPVKLSLIVDWFEKELKKPQYADVNGIACRGLSGTALVGALSYKLKINPIFIRKEPSPHDSRLLVTNGNDESFWGERHGRYIIVDDLICTGETINKIIEQVEEDKLYVNSKPLAIFLYCGRGDTTHFGIPVIDLSI